MEEIAQSSGLAIISSDDLQSRKEAIYKFIESKFDPDDVERVMESENAQHILGEATTVEEWLAFQRSVVDSLDIDTITFLEGFIAREDRIKIFDKEYCSSLSWSEGFFFGPLSQIVFSKPFQTY